MEILPFADPQIVQVLALAQTAEGTAGQLALLVLDVVPQVQVRSEVAVFVCKPAVSLVRLLLLVPGPLARVLDGESSDDDEHLAKRTIALSFEHHPSQARVKWQPGDLATVCREPTVRVGAPIGRGLDRLQLLQKSYAVGDLARVRRIQKREALDGT